MVLSTIAPWITLKKSQTRTQYCFEDPSEVKLGNDELNDGILQHTSRYLGGNPVYAGIKTVIKGAVDLRIVFANTEVKLAKVQAIAVMFNDQERYRLTALRLP
jgi:hypothetical protein